MIKFNNVDFTYQNAQNGAGVHNITLSIPQGQVVLLCGSSGCGKTTLTRMINGLIPHFYEGEMKGDVTVCGMLTADSDLYEIAPFVGSVFQNPKSQFYTVKTDTEIVFGMDEPTSNLDMKSISYLKEIIKKWKKSGKTVIIAEHRLYWLMDLADRVIYMDNGYIVQDLLINEFREYSENDLHQMGLRNSIASENSLYRCNERDTGLTFTDFSFSYKNAPHKALDIEKLSIPKGAIVAVLGNNGAGKTTFGRCLCGLEKRCKGTVILENRELTQKQRIALSYIVMQDVNHQLFTESVIDEILLSMEKQPGTLEEKEKRAMEILHLLKLQEFRECHPMSLSGGQKQRVAIASALGSGKKILVYDEPTSGLDYRHMLDVAEAIREMKKADNTQFIITHDAELVSHCCDYIILMQSGKIIKQGSLMNQDINKAVREFWKQ